MEAKLQRRIQRYGWDKASELYENAWREQLRPAQDRMLEMDALRPGERVLDVACGTGLVTFRAADAVAPNGAVVGTDISAEMVERARQIASDRGGANVTFERMDAEQLDLPDTSFDVALCALGLMYVPDPLQALREQLRVLKPGGRAAAAVWGERGKCGWAEIFPITDARVASEVCPMFFQMGTKNVLEQTMQMAGFSDVQFDRIDTTLHYDSGEEACAAAFAGGPVALAYSKFDDQTRDEAHADYIASLEPYRDGDSYAVPGEFVVAVGYRR
jgi:ubiquinone/menaquinone biosynthesis C-methylase UbiE